MNTKGIKFLAVLAVMAMAFAAVIVLAPADKDLVAEDIGLFDDAQINPVVITDEDSYAKYYISEDTTVKITGIKSSLSNGITFLVQNGKELEINVKTSEAQLGKPITIYSVTSDLQKQTTSTVDTDKGEKGTVTGKIKIMETVFSFTGTKGQTVSYLALMPGSVTTTYVNTTSFNTVVATTSASGTQHYAYISSDAALVGTPAIGAKVTVTPGQYIEVTGTDPGMDEYGVKTTTKDGNTTTVTYFAVGMDAGTVSIGETGESVVVKNGSAVAKNGNSTVRAVSVKGPATMSYADGQIDVSGSVTAGTLTASGKVKFATGFEVGSTKTTAGNVVVSNNTTIVSGSSVKVYGTLTLKNDSASTLTVSENGTIVAQNQKLWSYSTATQTEGQPYIAFANSESFTGQYDVSAITESADVKNRFATAAIAENQTFIVVADTTVTNSLDVKGILIINPGVTLTISKTQTTATTAIGATVSLTGQYAQIINNGKILIKTTGTGGLEINGGAAINNGDILGSSDANTTAATLRVNATVGYGFENNGTITMAKKDLLDITTGFENNGTLNVNGGFARASTIDNSGVMTLANAEIFTSLTVNMKKGASFNVTAAVLEENEFILVQHVTGQTVNASVKVLAPAVDAVDAVYTLRAMYIDDTTNSYTKKLDLSGALGVVKSPTTVTAGLGITLAGNIDVSDDANISNGFSLAFDSSVKPTVTVTGSLTAAKGIPCNTQTNLTLVVKGEGIATSIEGDVFAGCSYVAAKVTLSGATTVYTTLENAVPLAEAANATVIDVGGTSTSKVTVTSDIAIPSGMIVSGTNIVIGDSDNAPVVALGSSALFIFTNVDLKNGMIYAANANDIDDGSVHADVKVENDEVGSVTYMSIGVAILASIEGGVIELNQDVIITNEDFVIPAGVTIDATAGEQSHAVVFINSNLTVNGMLVVDDFHFVATTNDDIEIILNGTIMDIDSDGDSITPYWFTPVGVSYNMTVEDEYGNEEVWYVITNIDNLQAAIILADDSKVAVEGNAKLGDVTITGTEDEPAEVTFKGNVSAGTITLDNAVIIAQNGKKITATFADALGSITITGAYVKNELAIYSLNEEGVYMAGSVTDATKGTYSIVFNGLTGIDGTNKASIGWGNYNQEPIVYPTVLFNGTTVATGKKVLIQHDTETTPSRANAGVVTIPGSLIADSGTKLIINADTEVLGALVALERGSIEINAHVFVGTTISEIYSAEAVIAASNANAFDGKTTYYDADYGEHARYHVVADSAVLSGKVEVGNAYFITAINGSLIDEGIVEDMDSVDVIIEDSVWLTVYGTANYSLDGLRAPIVNAKVDVIADAEGNAIAYYDHNYKVVYGSIAKPLSQYNGVYISLNYEAFTVKIKTDGSVKAVYIDGILMETGENKNIFTLKNQTTGTHKVTVEPSSGYTADGCVLYTEMGTILPGMAFTFTEFDCDNYQVTYNIKGTQVEPEPVPPTPEEESQWTITTILLVILVVLIAIMAVIVALRLNRS